MVISTVNQVVYNGDGSNKAWPYTFVIIDNTDIKLTIVDADGTETDVTSDYFVDTVNNTVYYPGYAPGEEPPEADQPPVLAVGQKLVVYRQIPITQEADLGESWPFYVIEKGLDKLTMILQQVYGWWNRSIKISESESALHPDFDTNIPIEAGKTFKVKNDGTGFETATDPAIAAAEAEAAKTAAQNAQTAAENAKTAAVNAKTAAETAQGKAEDAEEAAEAIASQIDIMARALVYDNVADMVDDTTLAEGQTTATKGYRAVNDGGASVYTIRAKVPTDVDDGGSIIILDNGKVAELITDGTVNVKQFGVAESNDDNIPYINNAIKYVNSLGGGIVVFTNGTYIIKPYHEGNDQTLWKQIYLRSNVKIDGNGSTLAIPTNYASEFNYLFVDYGAWHDEDTTDIEVCNFTFDLKPNASYVKSEHNMREVIRAIRCNRVHIHHCYFISNSLHILRFRNNIDVAEIVTNADNGIYQNKNFAVHDNTLEYVTFQTDYYDNTQVVWWGDALHYYNNRHIVTGGPFVTNNGGINAQLDIAGINIDVHDNEFLGALGAIDISCYDKYPKNRQIHFYCNNILAARGISLWSRLATDVLSGVQINDNSIVLDYTIEKGRYEHSARFAIGFSNHGGDSLGVRKNIIIDGNHISTTADSNTYIDAMDRTQAPSGTIKFNAFYCGITTAGQSKETLNVTISNNVFEDFDATCIAGWGSTLDCSVSGNTFINCGYNGSPVIYLMSYTRGMSIMNNVCKNNGDVANKYFISSDSDSRFHGGICANNRQSCSDGNATNTYPKPVYQNNYVYMRGNGSVDIMIVGNTPNSNTNSFDGCFWVNSASDGTDNLMWVTAGGNWMKIK